MEFSPGLRGVIAGETSISTVGKEGTSLRYRGYDAIELTKNNKEINTFISVPLGPKFYSLGPQI